MGRLGVLVPGHWLRHIGGAVMVGDINKLAQSIVDATVPLWLHEYVVQHRDQMCAELKLFGQCEIPMPDGGVIVVSSKRRVIVVSREQVQ